jgi:DNA repair exonuclease SbcCD ATPase subunit
MKKELYLCAALAIVCAMGVTSVQAEELTTTTAGTPNTSTVTRPTTNAKPATSEELRARKDALEQQKNAIKERQEEKNVLNTQKKEAISTAKEQKAAVKVSVSSTKADLAQVRELRQEEIKKLQDKRATVQADWQKKQDALKEQLKAKQIEAQKKIEANRETLKAKLEKVKDENRKKIVENVNEQMISLNQKATEQFSNTLERLGAVVVKLKTRADRGTTLGIDVTAAKAAITKAETAIATAQTAVKTQSGKTYTITITEDATLHTDLTKTKDALRKDVNAVQELVKTAKDAVQAILPLLATVPAGSVTSTIVNVQQ